MRGGRLLKTDLCVLSSPQRQVGFSPKRMLVTDSQVVKNTCNASIKSKGFCHYKCTNGINRHLAVDTLGLPFFRHCTKANVTDDQGLYAFGGAKPYEMLRHNLNYFRVKTVNIAEVTILLDHGYHPDTITKALQALYPQILTKVRFQLAPKPTKADKAAQGKTGVVPVATRWIIERSNAWMEHCKSLLKNFEPTLTHPTAKLSLCFIRLMLKRWSNA